MVGKRKTPFKKAKASKKLRILDENEQEAPRVTMASLRQKSGEAFKLAQKRGAVVITRGGKDAAVMVSLAQFWKLLFEFALRNAPVVLKKPTPRKRRPR